MLSLSPLCGRPSPVKSRPVSLSLMRFITATALSFRTWNEGGEGLKLSVQQSGGGGIFYAHKKSSSSVR